MPAPHSAQVPYARAPSVHRLLLLLLLLLPPLRPLPFPASQALRDGVPDKDGNVAQGYKYTQNAGEIFSSFFGTDNPFADFGFGQSVPFASRLRRPGPKKVQPARPPAPRP